MQRVYNFSLQLDWLEEVSGTLIGALLAEELNPNTVQSIMQQKFM